MNADVKSDTHAIVIDEIFPHSPATIWKALTASDLIGRWIMMTPTGFAPMVGKQFTFQTTCADDWDGVIRCEVLEAVANERLAYSWKSGVATNVGYGAVMNTVVTWTLTPSKSGTRLRLVHSGFVLPRNEGAYRNMGEGWKRIVKTIDTIATELN
ncbi:MAG: SRPBCC domain-containing protein [Rhizomicrobium sp.]